MLVRQGPRRLRGECAVWSLLLACPGCLSSLHRKAGSPASLREQGKLESRADGPAWLNGIDSPARVHSTEGHPKRTLRRHVERDFGFRHSQLPPPDRPTPKPTFCGVPSLTGPDLGVPSTRAQPLLRLAPSGLPSGQAAYPRPAGKHRLSPIPTSCEVPTLAGPKLGIPSVGP